MTDRPIFLQEASLRRLPNTISVPDYNRARLAPAIVHLGVGGFHRAHQAVYVDDLCRQRVRDWGIVGAGLMPADGAMREALAAQDYLYTLLEKSANAASVRVIGSLMDFVHASGDPQPLIRRLAEPTTRIVSLTITEGGYCVDPDSGGLNLAEPTVRHDLEHPQMPRGVYGILATALSRRRSAGRPPFTVMSCDNLQGNGDLIRRLLMEFAGQCDEALAQWLEREGAFPNSMVDRITPVTGDADRAFLTEQFHIQDRWPVVAEPFRQWVLEDRFSAGRPDWARVGVLLTDDVAPYETMKLRLLNAGHSALAYAGALAGLQRVDEVMADGLFHDYLRDLMDLEVTPLLPPVPGVDLDDYKATLRTRFANPAVGDRLSRLCQAGSAKLPVFVLPSIVEQRQRGGPHDRLLLVLACWCRYLTGRDEAGRELPIDDPLAAELAARAGQARQDPAAFFQLPAVFPAPLREDAALHRRFGELLHGLYERGVRSLLADLGGAV